MRFNADEIVSVLTEEIQNYRGRVESREVGKVLEVGDGIARVYGLSGVMANEMVEFTRAKVRGLAFNLEENSVGVIILGDYLEISEGDEVFTTGELLRVPVGDAVIGRGKIDAFPESLKQFRESCFVFTFAGDVPRQAADAMDYIVANDGMQNAVEIVR